MTSQVVNTYDTKSTFVWNALDAKLFSFHRNEQNETLNMDADIRINVGFHQVPSPANTTGDVVLLNRVPIMV